MVLPTIPYNFIYLSTINNMPFKVSEKRIENVISIYFDCLVSCGMQ